MSPGTLRLGASRHSMDVGRWPGNHAGNELIVKTRHGKGRGGRFIGRSMRTLGGKPDGRTGFEAGVTVVILQLFRSERFLRRSPLGCCPQGGRYLPPGQDCRKCRRKERLRMEEPLPQLQLEQHQVVRFGRSGGMDGVRVRDPDHAVLVVAAGPAVGQGDGGRGVLPA